eukprot:Lankesteria_metandrocarpae@DN10399_c0_g1_i1.p1
MMNQFMLPLPSLVMLLVLLVCTSVVIVALPNSPLKSASSSPSSTIDNLLEEYSKQLQVHHMGLTPTLSMWKRLRRKRSMRNMPRNMSDVQVKLFFTKVLRPQLQDFYNRGVIPHDATCVFVATETLDANERDN